MKLFGKEFGKKKDEKGFCIKPGHSAVGMVRIPIDTFPEEVRELLKDPIKNKDEIIRIVGESGIYVVVNMGYEDDFGKKYEQKWKMNIITGDAEEIGGDGLLRMRSKGIGLGQR